MSQKLEGKVGNLEGENGKDSEEGLKISWPLIAKIGIGYGIYCGICASVLYLRNHPEVHEQIMSYFK